MAAKKKCVRDELAFERPAEKKELKTLRSKSMQNSEIYTLHVFMLQAQYFNKYIHFIGNGMRRKNSNCCTHTHINSFSLSLSMRIRKIVP